MDRAPLNWLQAFEAAGRTGSFKAAAEELHVSPSNISHQIRDLEAYLGTLLFSRQGRQVKLTEEGRNYLPGLTQGFQAIRDASPKSRPASRQLHIGAFPFLANEVVTPNIATLKALLSRTEIRLFTRTDLQALTQVHTEDRLDVVIRYGPADGRFPGFLAEKLGDVALVPVVAASAPHISDADVLLSQPWIRVIGPFQGWDLWREAYAPAAEERVYALETDSFHAAMLAVERGEGACLAVLPFLTPWIRSGRVRALHDLTLPVTAQAAYAVWAPYQRANPQIPVFIDWLVRQLDE